MCHIFGASLAWGGRVKPDHDDIGRVGLHFYPCHDIRRRQITHSRVRSRNPNCR